MVPVQVTVIPLFLLMRNLGLIDNPLALILPALTGAFGVFLMRQFFLGLPEEILEAARIDGAGPFTVYRLIALPLAKPGLSALGTITFLTTLERLLRTVDLPQQHRHRDDASRPGPHARSVQDRRRGHDHGGHHDRDHSSLPGLPRRAALDRRKSHLHGRQGLNAQPPRFTTTLEGTTMTTGPDGLLSDLTRIRDARSARSSSWDQSGRNKDNWVVGPGQSVVLADIEGPGCITHIWMTQSCRVILGRACIPPELVGVPMLEIHNALGVNWEVVDPDYYRKILLKIYWDDQEQPSVLVPLGDFFGLMNSLAGNYSSLPLSVSVKDVERNIFGGSASFNSYFQMPFGSRARIEVENQNDVPYLQYFYIDYELYRDALPDTTAYFHAQWRREQPCDGWGPDLQTNSFEVGVSPTWTARAITSSWTWRVRATTSAASWRSVTFRVRGGAKAMTCSSSTTTPGHRACTAPGARTTSVTPGGCSTTTTPCAEPSCTRRTSRASSTAIASTSPTRCASPSD